MPTHQSARDRRRIPETTSQNGPNSDRPRRIPRKGGCRYRAETSSCGRVCGIFCSRGRKLYVPLPSTIASMSSSSLPKRTRRGLDRKPAAEFADSDTVRRPWRSRNGENRRTQSWANTLTGSIRCASLPPCWFSKVGYASRNPLARHLR